MGRGLAYEISDNVANLNSMDKDTIEANAPALEIDYCLPMDPEAKAKAQKKLCEIFKAKGAIIAKDGNIYSITNVDKLVKENYFRERYEQMRKISASITLESFASNPYDSSLYNLVNAVYQQWSDIVYFNGVIYTMDSFIRSMEAKTTYFIGNIVYMN